jgi:hypothetical protein
MFRNRFLILLGASFLAASAALADDVGFIDCSSHSEGAQVFGKPRRTPDVQASLSCGERFTILVYGFVFSRIQTSDGKIGFVYSNLISVDRSGASVQQTSSPRMVSASEKVTVKSEPAPAPQPKPQERAPVQSVSAQLATPAQPAPAQMPEPTSSTMASSAQASNAPVAPAAVAQPTPAPMPAPAPPPEPPAAAQPVPAQPAPAQPAPAPASEATMPSAPSSVPETSATPAQPDPSPAAEPQPAPAQPAAPAIRPKESTSTWEKRNPGGIRHTPLIEVFGGYAFARQDNGAGYSSTNLNGGMGSVGWNFKPWLQVVADSSYNVVNVVTTSGTNKNVLYGNHFGPRYFYRTRNRWGAIPFVEALIGGSRADTTFPAGGGTFSQNCMSYKVGGGLDLHPSRHWEIRVFDVDYYRTAFGTNMHQNNYWASAGIVLRLFGGSSDY